MTTKTNYKIVITHIRPGYWDTPKPSIRPESMTKYYANDEVCIQSYKELVYEITRSIANLKVVSLERYSNEIMQEKITLKKIGSYYAD